MHVPFIKPNHRHIFMSVQVVFLDVFNGLEKCRRPLNKNIFFVDDTKCLKTKQTKKLKCFLHMF